MGKAINSFIDSQENQNETRNVVALKFVDFLHPKGERVKYMVKDSNRNPQIRVPTKIRLVNYVYPHKNPSQTKTTQGWEIVEEILIPRETQIIPEPIVVAEVTRTIIASRREVYE
jgi:hypothetical protein